MNQTITRRDFVRKTAVTAGAVLAWSVMPGTALTAGNAKKVKFTVKPGIRGCSHCEKMVKKMLADKAKVAKLEELFPKNSTVVFYMRRPKSSTKVAEHAVIVGGCSRRLKSKGDVFVRGCRRQISDDLIYNTIMKKLKKTTSA